MEKKYPPELLEGRLTIEGNVIACIWKDPLLLDETQLSGKDFITTDGNFYFLLAKQLRNKGYCSLDEVTVLTNISKKTEMNFDERGGWESIRNLMEIVNEKNWKIYIDLLYRENIIRNLFLDGFNLFKEVNFNNKKIAPLKLFREMDSESVLDWYESRMSVYGTGYSNRVFEEEVLEIDDPFIESCVTGAENGVPFDIAGKDIEGSDMVCFRQISKHISGLMDGTTTVLGGYSSAGKTTAWITVIMGLLHYDRKVVIISNEQRAKVFKVNFLIWIIVKYFKYYKITKKKLKSGGLNEEEISFIRKAQLYWNENYKGKIKFISIPDANMSLVKKKIRENVLMHGYDTVLYDTLKIDFSYDKNNGESQHFLSLIKDSRELDAIAKKYNIIMLCSLQLAINTLGKLFLDASVLSMSKQIKEVLENLLLLRTVYPEELDKDNKKYYCHPFNLKHINGVWVEEEYTPDPTATYRMLFIDKAREGDNSSDTGVAYLLRFIGATGTFTEVARARPKHTTI